MSSGEAAFAFFALAAGLPPPAREYAFSKPRRWRFDFAWPDMKVALEVEGGTWTGGRHTRGTGYAKDCEKYAEAAIQGWIVIRATTEQVRNGQALAWVTRAIESRKGFEHGSR